MGVIVMSGKIDHTSSSSESHVVAFKQTFPHDESANRVKKSDRVGEFAPQMILLNEKNPSKELSLNKIPKRKEVIEDSEKKTEKIFKEQVSEPKKKEEDKKELKRSALETSSPKSGRSFLRHSDSKSIKDSLRLPKFSSSDPSLISKSKSEKISSRKIINVKHPVEEKVFLARDALIKDLAKSGKDDLYIENKIALFIGKCIKSKKEEIGKTKRTEELEIFKDVYLNSDSIKKEIQQAKSGDSSKVLTGADHRKFLEDSYKGSKQSLEYHETNLALHRSYRDNVVNELEAAFDMLRLLGVPENELSKHSEVIPIMDKKVNLEDTIHGIEKEIAGTLKNNYLENLMANTYKTL